eukprot:CAMPEP_0170190048 /NCGR_PEP_ID=MMETSP0040_2-20121228/48419_1 /TAXON_ID=641309 /ORGANISM="Lotharella oceanica, Strain CCMP622" /LENGTH=198 /DNA_ID=CAMNT_0010437799 /DNA_START=233 /DNA_END=830 /DNA_ORIENTATION=-
MTSTENREDHDGEGISEGEDGEKEGRNSHAGLVSSILFPLVTHLTIAWEEPDASDASNDVDSRHQQRIMCHAIIRRCIVVVFVDIGKTEGRHQLRGDDDAQRDECIRHRNQELVRRCLQVRRRELNNSHGHHHLRDALHKLLTAIDANGEVGIPECGEDRHQPQQVQAGRDADRPPLRDPPVVVEQIRLEDPDANAQH